MPEKFEGEGLRTVRWTRLLGCLTGPGDSVGELGEDDDGKGEGLDTIRRTRFLGCLIGGDSVGDSERVVGGLGEDDDGQDRLLITEHALGVGVCSGSRDLMLRESVVAGETGGLVDK